MSAYPCLAPSSRNAFAGFRPVTASRPIGVFDSGLGGLSVLGALRETLPGENFIYLGDVARLPYGTKSATVVLRYAQSCLEFLRSHDVKLITIACNTATALALESLREISDIPILGVIDPGVRSGADATKNRSVLVLGTEATVRSEAYPRAFRRVAPDVQVRQKACPLLVPLAEAGWFDHPVTHEVIRTYLDEVGKAEYDTVVLGCTHYPLLEPSFRAVMGQETRLVHSGRALAEQVERCLRELEMSSSQSSRGTLRFFATDHVSRDLPLVRGLFGQSIEFELVDL